MTESVEANSAKSFSLVGLIFYVIGAIGSLFPLMFLLLVDLNQPPYNANIPFDLSTFFPALFPLAALFAINVGFAVWSWINMNNIGKGKYAEARTATLILGVFGLFLAWIVGGIFLLLAYDKLGKVMRERQVSQADIPPKEESKPDVATPRRQRKMQKEAS